MIPETFVQELLARVDIADVVGRHVSLRKRGANLVGLCPFHGEKTPSFTVSPTKQFYHCFGCGVSGNAISFYIQFLGVSFPEAVRTLAQEVGLQVPQSPKSPEQRRIEKERQKVRTLHEHFLHQAQQFYQGQLRQSLPALNYFRQRGIKTETIQKFDLGWAPDEWQALARVFDNYQRAELLETGLIAEGKEGRRYDRFRGRIIFPIRNHRGVTVGFGGRLIAEGEPKYLNSPETELFSKSNELYGIWESRQGIHQEGYALVVEGYMDVVALSQLGMHNAVATLGTATTDQHLRRLTRFTNKIIFCFDADRAGQQAAWRALEHALGLVRDDLALHFMFLPQGHDPDSYAREYGITAFREYADQAQVFSEFFLQEWSRRHDLDLVEGRSACVHEAIPYLAKLEPNNYGKQLCQAFAQQVRLTIEELEQQIEQYRERQQANRYSRDASAQPASTARGMGAGRDSNRTASVPARARPEGQPPGIPRSARHRQHTARQVVPLAKRLLHLLVAYPELAAELDAEQLEIIVQSPHLLYVQELISLINDTGCAHGGALLQAADPNSELGMHLQQVTHEADQNEPLPDPRAEWADALKRVEIDCIKAEQLELLARGIHESQTRQRYQFLTRRLAELTTASSI
ncbi:MAG TPA: DNA primase [Paenalcaligenes sp.]|nr:DNA primase [Paenalcaligenes sp.]